MRPEPPGDSGRRALVLGASGFIGGWVARRLADRGVRQTLVARDAARIDMLDSSRPDASVVEADLLEPGAVEELVDDVRPEVTFNLVGYGVDPDERDEELAFRTNSELVERICTAIAALGPGEGDAGRVRLVHVGSALEYGEAGGDLREETSPRPTTLYGRSKLAGTRAVLRARREFGLQGLSARLFTVYGPGEHPSRLLPSLMRIAATGDVLELTAGIQERDFVFVADVADGLLRLGSLEAPKHRVFNLATGELTSVREFVTIASGVLGIRSHQLQFGALPVRPEEMRPSAVSVRRLTRAVGWRPATTIEEGVAKTRDFRRPSAR